MFLYSISNFYKNFQKLGTCEDLDLTLKTFNEYSHEISAYEWYFELEDFDVNIIYDLLKEYNASLKPNTNWFTLSKKDIVLKIIQLYFCENNIDAKFTKVDNQQLFKNLIETFEVGKKALLKPYCVRFTIPYSYTKKEIIEELKAYYPRYD